MCVLWPRTYGELEPDDIYSVLGRCKLPVARNHTRSEPNSGSDCKRVGIGQGKAGLDPRRIDDLGVSVRNDLQWKCFEVTEDVLAGLRGDAAVAAALPDLERKVGLGDMLPGAAARAIVAAYRRGRG